jgi:protein PET100
MYYFGTNLEERFAVPDFWPKPEQSHRIPHERSEIDKELARMKREKEQRLLERKQREQQLQGPSEGVPST